MIRHLFWGRHGIRCNRFRRVAPAVCTVGDIHHWRDGGGQWTEAVFLTRKAIFFDIDGTLINIMQQRPQMTERTRQAIESLRRAGHRTLIASGRPFVYLDDELTTQGLFDGYVLMNGAAVFVDGRCVYEQSLPRALVQEIVALSEEHGVEYILQGPRQVYLRPEFHGLERFYRGIGIDTGRFVRSFSLENIAVCKMEFLSFEAEGGGVFRRLLAMPGLTGLMDPYHKKNMELYASDISKGSGILRALDALSIPVNDSIAFGDGLNDIEMMQTVGTGVAMGNARPEVKAVARYTVPSVDEDGVAWGISHLILHCDD